MRGQLWAWLSRLVVRFYPRELRERYGQEVGGPLSRSTSARDLADVAWCAALERAGGITFAGVRRWMLRSVALAALVPVATFVWVALAVTASVVFPSTMMPDRWWTLWIMLVYTAVPALVLAPLAFWSAVCWRGRGRCRPRLWPAAWRRGRSDRLRSPEPKDLVAA